MSATSPGDFKTLVARQFATRPTLRSVLSQQLLAVLARSYPPLTTVQPPLADADAVLLLSPDPLRPAWTSRPLIEVAMQAILEQKPLDFSPVADRRYPFSLSAEHRFPGNDDPWVYFEVDAADSAINALLRQLPVWFQQAQIDYWNAEGSTGLARDLWLQGVMKQALLQNLPLQNLDQQQQSCIYGLLQGGAQAPSVFAVQARLGQGERLQDITLANLLVVAEWDERQVLLWIAPSGVIQAFDTADGFGAALVDQLAADHRFERLSWDRHLLQGDAFAVQASLLLECLFERIDRVQVKQFDDIAHLERCLLSLSDPSLYFIAEYVTQTPASVQLPPGLTLANPADSLAYQTALLQLTIDQLASAGASALDGVPDLRAFARQRLAEVMATHDDGSAVYDSDELMLELAIARGSPGGAGAGSGGGETLEALGQKSLTEFAIGNLCSLHGAFIKRISHSAGLALPGWMNADYLKALVSDADIGGRYPNLVAQRLDERGKRPERVRLFARQWRSALMFQALSAKLDNTLSAVGLQVVVDYCRGHVDAQVPGIALVPLAFKRGSESAKRDLVRGAYVLFCAEPARVLLYCPLLKQGVLREFDSLAALLQSIRASDSLQEQLLAWMESDVQGIYQAGGFAEPHVASIGIDPYNLPQTPTPVTLDVRLWLHQVDEKLYTANRDLLVELAEMQSTSTAQSRWRTLVEGAWLLFDTATLLIRGPVASVAWLLQLLKGLDDDLRLLQGATQFERSAAAVDVLLNVGLALLHQSAGDAMRVPAAPARLEPALPGIEPPTASPAVSVSQGKVYLDQPLGLVGSQLDMSMRGNQGYNFLTAQNKRELQRMQVAIKLDGLQPIATGMHQGLYEIEGAFYLRMAGMTFRVDSVEGGIRIYDGAQLTGPWLQRVAGAWRIDRAVRGLGGMPKSRVERIREAKQTLLEKLRPQEVILMNERNALQEQYDKHLNHMSKARQDLDAYQGEVGTPSYAILKALVKQSHLRVLEDLKALIAKSFQHDDVVSQIADTGLNTDDLQDRVRVQRNGTRYDLIKFCNVYAKELMELITEANLQRLGENVAVLPETEAQKHSYREFFAQVEAVVRWRTELVELSGKFDSVLDESIKDPLIAFRDARTAERINKQTWLGEIIQERRVTAIDQQFGLLMDLAEASLNRLAAVDEKVLIDYANYLSNAELRSSGSAHGELTGELQVDERIDILGGILQDYEQAQAMSDYLASLGGEAIRQDQLAAYRLVLKRLMTAARADLDSAVREKDLAEPRRLRTPLYASRGARRKVVTTRRGHKVVGEEAEAGGETVVRQLDYREAVLKTFRQREGTWIEDPDAAPTTPDSSNAHEDSHAPARASALLAQVEKVITLARQYLKSDEPHGLQTVVDGHIQKLTEVAAKVAGAHHETLLDSLNDGIERLQQARDDMLRGLYLSTRHPTAQSLRFLLQHEEVTVSRSQLRKATLAGDYLDIYEVRRRAVGTQTQGKGLWEAHFHYPEATTPALAFSKGHLKIWSERKLGREAQMRAAQTRNELLFIYRGDLKADQVSDLFPFE